MMSRNAAFVFLLAASSILSGCRGVKDASVDMEAIKAQVRRADAALLRAEAQRDLEAAMEWIAPHAVFQPPGFPRIVGLEAIKRFYETEWFKIPFIEISGSPEAILVGSSGDLACFDGKSRMVLEVAGERTVSIGKYLGVWRLLEGKWKLAAISWSANEAAR